VGDHRRAVLHERCDAAGVIAVIVRDRDLFDRKRRDLDHRRLDLVVQRRELGVDHQDAVVPDGDGDIPALTGQHIGLVAQVLGDDLHFAEVGRSLREGRSRQHQRGGDRHQYCAHAYLPDEALFAGVESPEASDWQSREVSTPATFCRLRS
jgi:hypothetical protein